MTDVRARHWAEVRPWQTNAALVLIGCGMVWLTRRLVGEYSHYTIGFLLGSLLRPLRFDQPLLVDEPPRKPSQQGNADGGERIEDNQERLRRLPQDLPIDSIDRAQ